MKRFSSRAIGVVIVAAACHLLPTTAHAQAQEWSTENLILKKTYIKTGSDEFVLHFGYQDVFTPTTISCSGAGSCVVRVDLSAMFGFLDNQFLLACVYLDGTAQGVLPGSCVNLAPRSDVGGQLFFSSGFTWAFPVTLGNHVITIQMSTYGDPEASVSFRTQAISVFKP